MRNSSLSKQLVQLPAAADVYILLPDGTALPLQAFGVKAIRAAPRRGADGKITLVRSKRALKRIILTAAKVAEDGPDDAPLAPDANRPGIDL